MNKEVQNVYLAVLASLAIAGPKPLQPRLALDADDTDLDVSLPSLIRHLRSAGPNDPVKRRFSLELALWDNADEYEPWTDGTERRTADRRTTIYRRLGLSSDHHSVFTILFPIKQDSHVVIATAFEPWYTSHLQSERAFYWLAYQEYLMRKPGWDAESMADLSEATTEIVQRLSDPTRREAYQAKGLVVGYVQSGKTANITGVLAKAIDAGYRLLIVLTGTINLLREQTQRRIDMELVGVENIIRGADPNDPEAMTAVDYQDDPDWDRFISHGLLPSSQNRPDIIRLTGRTGDYQSLKAGITTLEYKKHDNTLPLNDGKNLDRCSARLAVVKKNKAVLTKLVRDLKSIRPKLGEIPALIIDDESDYASVNTTNPTKWKEGDPERTAINKLISQLLGLLPRAQYIGYTATPFANVFIDPDDAEDIFPKDFIIALTRPPGYMGASDLHDFDPELDEEGRPVPSSRERAHVRNLLAPKDDHTGRAAEIREALGMLLLAGAIKLFREHHGSPEFRHHTMLAHESVKRDDHLALAEEIKEAWNSAAFSSPSGLSYLQRLYQGDVVPTTTGLGEGELPATFEELKPFIGGAISKIATTGNPVIIVNSNREITEDVDFDKRSLWRVLVGGAKLSRGFTVEGLTISYYRRKTYQSDTLMQMGRWFGFRKGYQDLVRLYIGRREQAGRKTIDLYEAFGAVMHAEELFRGELGRYAKSINGQPQITPAQVPPLVTQHLPWLRPTSPNKMFNARLVVRRLKEIEPTAYPDLPAEIEHNYNALLPLMRKAVGRAELAFPKNTGQGSYLATYGIVTHDVLLSALEQLKWIYEDYFDPNLAFVTEIRGSVDSWVVLMPQRRDQPPHGLPNLGTKSVFYRNRNRGKLFQAISDPKHRDTARRIAGIATKPFTDTVADRLATDRRGALIVYPIVEERSLAGDSRTDIQPSSCIIGLRIVPPNSVRKPDTPYVGFKVYRDDKPNEIIVPSSHTGTG